jgi:hypothetical protein
MIFSSTQIFYNKSLIKFRRNRGGGSSSLQYQSTRPSCVSTKQDIDAAFYGVLSSVKFKFHSGRVFSRMFDPPLLEALEWKGS